MYLFLVTLTIDMKDQQRCHTPAIKQTRVQIVLLDYQF